MKKLASSLSLRRRQGQGMTEYVMIVGLVAVLMVPAVSRLKDALANGWDASARAVDNDVTAKISTGPWRPWR